MSDPKDKIDGFEALDCKEKLVKLRMQHTVLRTEYINSTPERRKEIMKELGEIEESVTELEYEYFGIRPNELREAEERLDKVMDTAFRTDDPPMLDWATIKFALKERRRMLHAKHQHRIGVV